MKYPTIVWYKVINVFVMIAIFCTFPLQLTPAMEVLNEWFGPGCDPKCCSSSSGSTTNSSTSTGTFTGTSNTTSASSNDTRLRGLLSVRRRRQRRRRGHTQIAQQDYNENDDDEFTTVEEEALSEDALAEEALAEEVEIHSSSNSNIISNNNNNGNSNNNNSRAASINTTVGDGAGDGDGSDGIFVMNSSSTTCFGQYEWIFRRYIVVFCCTIVVLSVNDLGLLMSLFGAVGNTGLAGMPCLIHLRLMKLNIAPYSGILRFIDIGTILLCTLVAITGVIFTLQEII